MISIYHEIVYIWIYFVDMMNLVCIKAILDISANERLFSICLFCKLLYGVSLFYVGVEYG